MGYQEQLREAREILQTEIKELHDNLASKEFALRKIDGILKGSGSGRGRRPSLTSQIVEALYSLSKEHERGGSGQGGDRGIRGPAAGCEPFYDSFHFVSGDT